MPYSISIDPADGIVTVQIDGEFPYEEHRKFRDRALELCRQNKSSKILVDLRSLITGKGTFLQFFDFGQSFAKERPQVRIANVLPEDEKSRNDVIFTSTVGANRGLLSKEFATVEEAKKWLME
jgi:hypothetical protein